MSESSDHHHEPSYYEIALTHRQVLFGFVILLACLMATFFAGVWMGRGGEVAQAAVPVAADEGQQSAEGSLPQINFFAEEGAAGGAEPVQAAQGAAAGDPGGTTLRQDVAAPGQTADGRTPVQLSEEAKARRRDRIRQRREEEQKAAAGGATQSAQPQVASAKPTEVQAKPTQPRPIPPKAQQTKPAPKTPQPSDARPALDPKPVAPSASSSGTTAERFVIQVLSTRERAKANDVVKRLNAGGYKTSMSTVEQGTQVMYRVRVGPYPTRAEAEGAADTVRRSFKLDTWVTAE